MKSLLILSLLSLCYAISPDQVIILYNSDSTESKNIADHYQTARKIPAKHVIGLPMSESGAISIKAFEDTIETPLKAELDKRKLWTRTSVGRVTECKFHVLVTVYGVPFKTNHDQIPASVGTDGQEIPARMPSGFEVDGASIDSELSQLKARNSIRKGALKNHYYKSMDRYAEVRDPSLILVGRIDAPTPELCHRMINDAIETERVGLFGKTYLDFAYKGKGYEIGDQWLSTIKRQNRKYGIPTIEEKTKDVFVTNYPLEDAALYFGWYSQNYSGPFRNDALTLKKGSIITHLHSFSAVDLRNSKRFWCGPVLAQGAAATLGNVYEPYLSVSHNFDIFHNRLLKGWSLVEAAYAAHPATSWHGIVLGDPLYRPFVNTRKKRPANPIDADYYQLRNIGLISSRKTFNQLQSLASKQDSPRLYEALALAYLEGKNHGRAIDFFRLAQSHAQTPATKIRQIINQIDYYRHRDQKDKAIMITKANQIGFEDRPEQLALIALKNILDPPPPPPVESQPKN